MRSLYDLHDELNALSIDVKVKQNNLHLDGNRSALSNSLLDRIRENKEAFINFLTDKSKEDIGLPLTRSQYALWSLCQLHTKPEIFNLVKTYRLHRGFNSELLEKCFVSIIHQYRILRSVYVKCDDVVRLFQKTDTSFRLDTFQCEKEELPEKVAAFADQAFNLGRDLPIRVAIFYVGQESYLVLVAHHIAIDHAACQILLESLINYFLQYVKHDFRVVDKLTYNSSHVHEDAYIDFIHDNIRYCYSENREKDNEYWKAKLDGLPAKFLINSGTSGRKTHCNYNYITFNKNSEATQTVAQNFNVTPYIIYFSVYSLLQMCLSGLPDTVVGTPVSCRDKLRLKNVVGFLVNVIPIRVAFDLNASFIELCEQVAKLIGQGLAHQSLPLADIAVANKLDVIKSLLVWHPDSANASSLVRTHLGDEVFLIPQVRGINEDMLLIISCQQSDFKFEFYLNNDVFSSKEADNCASQFLALCRQFIENPKISLKEGISSALCAMNHPNLIEEYQHSYQLRHILVHLIQKNGQGSSGSAKNDSEQLSVTKECLATKYKIINTNYLVDGKLYDASLVEQRFLEENNRIKRCKLLRLPIINGYKSVMFFSAAEWLDTSAFASGLVIDNQSIEIDEYRQILRFPLLGSGQIDLCTLERPLGLSERDTELFSQQVRESSVFTDVFILPPELIEASTSLHVAEFRPNDAMSFNASALPRLSNSVHENTGLPLAIVHGPSLPLQTYKTLTEAILQTVSKYPEKGMFYYLSQAEYFQSYQELYKRALHILKGLQAIGLKPKDKLILQITHLPDHFAVFWAAVLGGIIPVTVAIPTSYSSKNSVVDKLFHVWDLLKCPVVITNQSNKGSLLGINELYRGAAIQAHDIESLEKSEPSYDIFEAEPSDTVFYQLTSGSTGKPKCIQETHAGIIAHILGSAQMNGYDGKDVTLNWLPMDHVVPLLTFHLKDVYLGCTQIEVATELIIANPLCWLDLIEKHKVSHSWSPNFGFRLVTEALKKQKDKSWDLSSLKHLMNAGEQVTKTVCDQFLDSVKAFLVSSSVMQPAFGMAEACTCMTYLNDYSKQSGSLFIKKSSLMGILELSTENEESVGFVSLGTVMPGVSIRITDSCNQPVPELVIGRFQIKGPVITPGYYANSKANEESFVGEGWFNSGDLGFIYRSCLYLTGREKETIIINGANFYCYEIEDAVTSLQGIMPTYAAACGVPDKESGSEVLALFFVPTSEKVDEQMLLIAAIRQLVLQQFSVFPRYVIPLSLDEFRKTTSGKIQRQEMKRNFLGGAYNTRLIELDKHYTGNSVVPSWFYRQVWRQCDDIELAQHNKNVVFISNDLGLPATLADHTVLIFDATNPDGALELIYERLLNFYKIIIANFDSLLGLRFYVICKNTFKVLSNDRINPVLTGLSSLIKTMSMEAPFLHCQLIDTDGSIAIDNIIQRECATSARMAIVGYREKIRYTYGLSNINAKQISQNPISISINSLYLLVGGLGGIGNEIVKEFATQYQASFLFIGRRTDSEVSEQVTTLRATGIRCAYASYDLASITEAELESLTTCYEKQWSVRLMGVVHLAGTFPHNMLKNETVDTVMGAVKGKIAGLSEIKSLLKRRPNAFFIAFSSVNGFFGGVGSAAYAIANQIFESKIVELFAATEIPYRCLSWSMWRDTGMSKNYEYKELARSKGFHLISGQKALTAMNIAFALDVGLIHIGLDSSKPYISHAIIDNPKPIETLYSFRTVSDDFTSMQCNVNNEYGYRFKLHIKPEISYPLLLQEHIQSLKRKVLAAEHKEESLKTISPDVIESIKSVWQDVLRRDDVSIYSNFFDLGGGSLEIIRIREKLTKTFSVDIPVAQLFNNPTVVALAGLVSNQMPSQDRISLSLRGERKQQIYDRRLRRKSRSIY